MKLDLQNILNGFLMGFGAGFGWPLAQFILAKIFHA